VDGWRRFGLVVSVVLVTGTAEGCVDPAAAAEAGLVVAVWTFAGCVAAGACVVCGAAVGEAGCSAAGWFALVAARLRLRGPPAWASVASSEIAAIRISLRMETTVIWSIALTYWRLTGPSTRQPMRTDFD